MSLKAFKMPIMGQVAIVLVCLSLLGYVYVQPVTRVLKRNSLMLKWLDSAPWSEDESGLPWIRKLTQASRPSFLMLASQFEALCNSDQDGFCWRADMVRVIAETRQDDVLAQLDRYEPESTEQIMLAALAGDVAYANGDSGSAIEIWRQHLSAEMLIYRARVAVQRQDHRAAFALLASLGQGYVPDSGQQRTYLAAVLARLARFSAESANFADAEFYWRWAALQLPEQAAYYYGLGQALAHQERWEEAAAAYGDAIDLDPNRAHFYAGLAHALVRLGETDQAVGAARRALELDPDNAAAQRLLQRLGQD